MIRPQAPKIRFVNWMEIHRALVDLSKSIRADFSPDVMIAIAKGGLVPGRILLDILDIRDLGIVEVKFYKSIGSTIEKPYITFTAIPPLEGKRVLVVDDITDSGRTLQVIAELLSKFRYEKIKYAVLYYKPWSSFKPDYYHDMVTEWIVFPWEVCEAKREGISVEGMEEVEKACQ